MNIIQLDQAEVYLKQGKVLAYPTEAVYGLGCDAFNRQAVEKILALKRRDMIQGLIVLIDNWSQLEPLVTKIAEEKLEMVRQTWPGHVTWLFPKSSLIPTWLSGQHQTIAIRMSQHPVARNLCQYGPIVSTSANRSGYSPALTLSDLYSEFPQGIDAVVEGELGGANQPSQIYDVITGCRLR